MPEVPPWFFLVQELTSPSNLSYCYDDNLAMHIPLCRVTSAAKVDFEDIEKEQHRQSLEGWQDIWNIEKAAFPQEMTYYLDWHGDGIMGSQTFPDTTLLLRTFQICFRFRSGHRYRDKQTGTKHETQTIDVLTKSTFLASAAIRLLVVPLLVLSLKMQRPSHMTLARTPCCTTKVKQNGL